MLTNVKASEAFGLQAAINPSSQAVGSATSGWVSAALANKILGVVQWGVLGASATIDANIQQAKDGTGTGAKAIGSGRSIVQITGANSNQQAYINVDPQELDVEGGFSFVQLTITVGVAASLTAGAVFFMPREEPAAAPTSLVQTVG